MLPVEPAVITTEELGDSTDLVLGRPDKTRIAATTIPTVCTFKPEPVPIPFPLLYLLDFLYQGGKRR
jgi:hypothetical protein